MPRDREIWTTVLPPETKDVYTAILGVTKANRMDEGIYTCKVIDWGIEQCRSMHIHIKSPPRLRVDPASVTLHRGDSLRVRCLSPGNDDIKRYAQLGYSWTRNSQLFQSDPATVMWEDLYPDGSILKINNIQKSAEYTCIVSNTVRPVSKSVYITVIDRNAVQLCHVESAFAVRWPTSAPGAAIISDCPKGYEGYSRRVCEKRDWGNSSWLQPDFSLCIADQLLEIYNKFRALKSGFQQSNSSAILKACFDYANQRYKRFLPGEAGFLIDMLHEVDFYLQLKGTQLEREMAAEIILHILDKVMQNTESLNSQQQIKKLQLLTQSAALNRETIAASQLATSTSSATGTLSAATSSSASASSSSSSSSSSSQLAAATSSSAAVLIASAADATPSSSSSSSSSSASPSFTTGSKQQNAAISLLKSGTAAEGSRSAAAGAAGGIVTVDEDTLSLDRLNSLRIYMTSVKTLPFNLRIYGNDLFSDQLYMDIGLSPRLLNIMANSTIFASVISYKNLKSFLPKTYYMRGSDAKDTDYVLASRIIQTWLFQSNRSNDNLRVPLDLSFEAGHVEIIFQHESTSKDSDWLPVCGHDYKASFESTWRSDLCITKNLMENITRCICPLSGTYVVMLTKRNFNSTVPRPAQGPVFVIISCGCCLLQSCTAFAILLPIWYNRKCAIIFLKMQFCVSTSSVMVIFLLGFLKMLPVNMQAIVSSSLASLLLFGISTLIAIALVIHTEMVPKKFQHHHHVTTNATTAALVSSKQQQQQQQHQQQQQQQLQHLQQQQQLEKAGRSTQLQPQHTQQNSNNNYNNNNNLSAGIRGAIGISWLLPLLFAITSPLICSIIGKWPQNWWLEIMTNVAAQSTLTPTTSFDDALLVTKDVFSTSSDSDSFFNGDNLFESTNTATTATTTTTTTTTTTHTLSTTTTTTNNGAATTATRMSQSTLTPTTNGTVITTATTTTTMPLFSPPPMSFNKNGGILTTTASAASTTTTDESTAAPSLSFILFIIIDLLFILLFVALLINLMKKLLWLLRKNQQPHQHPHPLGKFNIALNKRIGLLYRSAILLFMKLTTDALFIAYVNSTEESWWGYPFGVASILLGFAILFCFVIKAEINLRSPASGGNTTAGMLKTKLNSSKTSLDENYCTGSLNSPLSFYTNQEKEKDNECGAPPSLTTILTTHHSGQTLPPSSVQQPLTIISTAPRCQMIAAGIHDQVGGSRSVETFLGGSLERKSCLQDMQQHQQQQKHLQHLQQTKEQLLKGNIGGSGISGVGGFVSTVTVASPATRCCNILGGVVGGGSGGGSNTTANMKQNLAEGILGENSSWQTQVGGMAVVAGGNAGVVYYDAYIGSGSMTGSLGRRPQQQQQQQQQQLYQQQLLVDGQREFVGVETLDILQGVAQDSIIGIRPSSMMAAHPLQQQQQQQYHQQQLPQHHKPFVEATMLPPVMVSIATNPNTAAQATNFTTNSSSSSSSNTTSITTNSVTTQTPKSQKRVTIMEPTTHTFDPLLPTMTAAATSTATHHVQPATTTPTPIITITSSSIDEAATESNNIAAATSTVAAVADSTDVTSVTPEDENSITGMFDRITHDLDYLLNRTNEVPPLLDDDIPPPPLPPSGSIPVASTCNRGSLQHDVIIEESEQE